MALGKTESLETAEYSTLTIQVRVHFKLRCCSGSNQSSRVHQSNDSVGRRSDMERFLTRSAFPTHCLKIAIGTVLARSVTRRLIRREVSQI